MSVVQHEALHALVSCTVMLHVIKYASKAQLEGLGSAYRNVQNVNQIINT